MTIFDNLALGLFGAGLLVLLLILLVGRSARQKPRVEAGPPPNAILVDGSNVMHWGGDASETVLRQVVSALQEAGLAPVVIFDANVGYKLGDRFLGSAAMAQRLQLPPERVYVVDAGVVADEVILDMARTYGLRVVSNDQFRDWRGQFPQIGRKGALVRGKWVSGNVVWQNPAQIQRRAA